MSYVHYVRGLSCLVFVYQGSGIVPFRYVFLKIVVKKWLYKPCCCIELIRIVCAGFFR